MKLTIIFRNKIKFLNDRNAFTLIEVILSITILSIFLFLSVNFLNFFIRFFNNEESKWFSKSDEKVVHFYFNRELLSAKDIQINDDEISFISYHKGEVSPISYSLYYSSSELALGKKTDSNRNEVINNIYDIEFIKKDDLIYITLILVDANDNKRKVIKVIKPRIRGE